MVTPTTPDLATVRAAVQAEIDALPRLRYTPRLATVADAPLVITLAQKYCAGLVSCGWEPTISGHASPDRLFLGIPIITESRKAPVSFALYVPTLPPRCELAALAFDISLPPPRQLEALFTPAVPVFRALLSLGWETIFAPNVPVDVLPIANLMNDSRGIQFDDAPARRQIETTGRTVPPNSALPRSLTAPLAPMLTVIERVVGLR